MEHEEVYSNIDDLQNQTVSPDVEETSNYQNVDLTQTDERHDYSVFLKKRKPCLKSSNFILKWAFMIFIFVLVGISFLILNSRMSDLDSMIKVKHDQINTNIEKNQKMLVKHLEKETSKNNNGVITETTSLRSSSQQSTTIRPTSQQTSSQQITSQPTTGHWTTSQNTRKQSTPSSYTSISSNGNCLESTQMNNGLTIICDNVTDGGNWTLVQRRVSHEIDFYRNWTEYEQGFGDYSSSFWLGLENIRNLCNQNTPCELRFDMAYAGQPKSSSVTKSSDGNYYAKYSLFYVADGIDNYRLTVSHYTGTAGDSWFSRDNNGREFSTYDRDHDTLSVSCAQRHHSGWWHRYCTHINPNGVMGSYRATTVDLTLAFWYSLSSLYNSVSATEMKVRRLK